MAALLLVLAATGALRALLAAERVARHARDAARAEAIVAARLDGWRAGACVATGGSREVGTLRETWTVQAGGGLATLTDSVAPMDDGAHPRAAATAVVACAP